MTDLTEDRGPHEGEIRLWPEDDWWLALDLDTGVTTQRTTRDAARENLDDAAALFTGERGREPTEEELRAVGIDPTDNFTGVEAPPDELK